MKTEIIMQNKALNIPDDFYTPLTGFVKTFHENGFECYLVGGSVRDIILGFDIYDYDFATNARPEQVMKLFKRVIPTGVKHGTVTVLVQGMEFEVTTYRADGKYFDGRRPETVYFASTLEEDVTRRDFTINGLALDIRTNEIIDHVKGLADIKEGIIRTIGNPDERFKEDGLRTYRACRLASKLNFEIEEKTFNSIGQALDVAGKVSVERIRDELLKILETDKPSVGFEYMRKTGLLMNSLPELAEAYSVEQNRFHVYDIYHHSLYSCDAAPKGNPLVRLAALFHDIGKVQTKRMGDDGDYTFYNHEVIGARIVRRIMKRLKFSNTEIDKVNNLVINHMFHYTNEWTDGAVRRFMRKVGVENLPDLFTLREADRSGNGSRFGIPEPIKKLQERIEQIIEAENAITVTDLDINGNIIMDAFDLKPGPVIGNILKELLELVLDNPEINDRDILLQEAAEIYERLKQ
jgi:poly(A) polymerase/tRNA nucleotidyltransferase (CCA-adding enzyme)